MILTENGLLREDLRIGLEAGVLPGDGYAEFTARYKAERKRHPLAPLAGRRSVLEKLLPEGATPGAADLRDIVQEAMSPLTVEGPSGLRFAGSTIRTVLKGSAVSCRSRAKRRDVLLKRLAARQPVGLGLLLNGVSDPALNAHRDSLGGEHYLVVTGYERRDDGYVFTIRNSHGEGPDSKSQLTEADLCAVFGMTWLSAPGDESANAAAK